MDKVAMLKLREQAFMQIREDEDGLWKQWCECKDEYGRELLMTQAIFDIVYSRGYNDGFADGYEDGSMEYGGA